MDRLNAIAFEEGKIIAQMIGLSGKPDVPEYYAGEIAKAFMRGYGAERQRMQRRVDRAKAA